MTQKSPDQWVRMLNGKQGLHLVVLYLVLGRWLDLLEEFSSLARVLVIQVRLGVQIAGDRSPVSRALGVQ